MTGLEVKEVRKILDTNNCQTTKITASNDLDEYTIQSLILEQKAPIDIFGVGTMLATSFDQPALGGVYKLKKTNSRDVIKISELPIKTTIPGATDVVRLIDENNRYAGDIICQNGHKFLNTHSLAVPITSIQIDGEKKKTFLTGKKAYSPLVEVIKNGVVNKTEMNRELKEIQTYAAKNLSKLDPTHLRLKSPHRYIAGLEKSLFIKRKKMRQHALKKGEYQNEG